jgi:ketosteroid isomerase-like protein
LQILVEGVLTILPKRAKLPVQAHILRQLTEEVIQNMIKEKVKIVGDFLNAFQDKEADKALSFITEDATWVAPHGTFKGKEELKHYITWSNQTTPDMKITYCGVGMLEQGDKAACEHILSGTFEGKKWELPALCSYEFNGDKISKITTAFDRLALAKQVATGFMAKRGVNAIISATERGLR